MSWIEVRLSEGVEGGTRLELAHVAHVADELWAQFGPGAVGGGRDLALMGLASHLCQGGDMDPAEAVAWSASEGGRRFMGANSVRWGEASAAAGTDADEARAAAERTTDFDTAAPPADADA